jgi:phosphoribosylformylglycinamidine synthase
MSTQAKVIVLRTAGTNCNSETAFAFARCGAVVEEVHLERLFSGKVHLADYHIMALPGGFSYGDDIASGRLFANELRLRLGQDVRRFIDDGKLVIGICNGFQILVKAGILPGPFKPATHRQSVTLTHNDSGKFEARWVHLKVEGRSVWTEGLKDIVYFPVAHGEGKFIPADKKTLQALGHSGQVAFRYVDENGADALYPQNPNGSLEAIAGITDPTGRVLGLMPHPERHFTHTQHPYWTRFGHPDQPGDGARIFQNGVDYATRTFCA